MIPQFDLGPKTVEGFQGFISLQRAQVGLGGGAERPMGERQGRVREQGGAIPLSLTEAPRLWG